MMKKNKIIVISIFVLIVNSISYSTPAYLWFNSAINVGAGSSSSFIKDRFTYWACQLTNEGYVNPNAQYYISNKTFSKKNLSSFGEEYVYPWRYNDFSLILNHGKGITAGGDPGIEMYMDNGYYGVVDWDQLNGYGQVYIRWIYLYSCEIMRDFEQGPYGDNSRVIQYYSDHVFKGVQAVMGYRTNVCATLDYYTHCEQLGYVFWYCWTHSYPLWEAHMNSAWYVGEPANWPCLSPAIIYNGGYHLKSYTTATLQQAVNGANGMIYEVYGDPEFY